MSWTRDLPVESGYYWVRGDGELTIVQYDHEHRVVLDVDVWSPLADFAADWDHWSSAPILPPS